MGTGGMSIKGKACIAGAYEHPGYGTLTITLNGGVLEPSLGTMRLSLAHRHYETFDLEWHEMDDQPAVFPLTFLSSPDGDVNALTVQFEPLVGPLHFARRPDAPGPEVLRRLCGSYAMGPIEVVVALRGERTLTVTTPGGPPLDLVPLDGLRFGEPEVPIGSVSAGRRARLRVVEAAVRRLSAPPLP